MKVCAAWLLTALCISPLLTSCQPDEFVVVLHGVAGTNTHNVQHSGVSSIPTIFLEADPSPQPSPSPSAKAYDATDAETAIVFQAKRASIIAELSGGLNLTALLFEFTDVERALLDKLTVLEASGDRSDVWKLQINETRTALQHVGETVTVARYLMQEEAEVVSQQLQLGQRQERLGKLQATLALLRKDNEDRAREYLEYNQAALIPSDKAVRAFAAAKVHIDAEYAAWEQAQQSTHSAFLSNLGTQVSSVGNGIARVRESLQDDYRVAGAAKRIIDALHDPVVNPSLGADSLEMLQLSGQALQASEEATRRGWTEARARDFGVISAYSEPIQKAREEIGALRQQIADTYRLMQAEQRKQAKLGLLQFANNTAAGNSSVSNAAMEAESTLADLMKKQLQALMQLVRGMLDSHHKQQLDARARGSGENSSSTQDNSLTAWAASPSELEDELRAINTQRERLAQARKVLEDELARRVARSGRGLWSVRSAGTAKNPLPPGAAGLLAAARASGGVAAGPSVTELVYSAALKRMLAGAGAVENETPVLGALNLGTGGVSGLGGCEFCAAQRQIGRLADEVHKLQTELGECVSKPAQYSPDCQGRLSFQIEKLVTEVQRRQALLSAEDVELRRVLGQLNKQLDTCNTENATANATCVDVEVRALESYRRLLKVELDTRDRMAAQAIARKQYACLWQHRNNTVSEVVARTMAEGDSEADNSFATSLAFLELESRSEEAPSPPKAEHVSRKQKLLNVCSVLKDPSFESGSALRACLCTEIEAVQMLQLKADAAAEARAQSYVQAAAIAAQAVMKDVQDKQAAEAAAVAAAKERLFQQLKSRPEFAQMFQDALQPK
jgi:hypothetical protein